MAFIALIIAGFQYLTSVGNAGRMKDAMDRIKSAGLGLVLLFGSFLILNTINPQLTDISMPPPEQLIKSEWPFDVQSQQLSDLKNKPKTCAKVTFYSDADLQGTPETAQGIGQYYNIEVKSMKIFGGCSVTLYDHPECKESALGTYYGYKDPDDKYGTIYGDIETGGANSIPCVKVAQMQ